MRTGSEESLSSVAINMTLIKDVDALILITEWNLFRQPDFEIMERMMKNKSIFDGRNQYDPKRLREQGWEYVGIGR